MNRLFEIFAVIGFGVVLFAICAGVGFLLTFLEEKKKGKKKKYITVTKRKLNQIINHAIIWVYLSFILAFMGKASIAEGISVQAIITIIGAFAAYCIKSAYEKKLGKEKEEYESIDEEIHEP